MLIKSLEKESLFHFSHVPWLRSLSAITKYMKFMDPYSQENYFLHKLENRISHLN